MTRDTERRLVFIIGVWALAYFAAGCSSGLERANWLCEYDVEPIATELYECADPQSQGATDEEVASAIETFTEVVCSCEGAFDWYETMDGCLHACGMTEVCLELALPHVRECLEEKAHE